MPKDNEITYKELRQMLEERSQEVIKRFGHVAISGLSHPKLLSIMGEVKNYWKDAYRPALTSFSCEAVGGQLAAVDDVNLVFSLVMAGMGIHDDVIDKSLNKHFRMTIPGLHSFDDALLVGGLLIIKGLMAAWELLRQKLQPKKILNIIETIQKSIFEIYEGEFLEISCRKDLDKELEDHIKYLWKFTADAGACARIGAILGDGSENEIEILTEFGRRQAFNIYLREELRDSLSIEGNLVHRLEYESVPLAILYAAKSSKARYREIKSIIEKSPITQVDARRLIEHCFETEAFTYIYDIAKQNTGVARQKLKMLPHSSAQETLGLMLEFSLAEITNLPIGILFTKTAADNRIDSSACST